ncbi:hypothetical protein H310_13874 [Aphanomyces invadans]|uniref:Activator of Hsp90 ATPase AHSA1-like N-terminal domain-containing protein n=1 Tax=Aphanomyces invadans TaxID=157072 RepID=A0A024TC89_9STRA|nr:hypothetical protein H310_13874 [Aphanomyces invadans]ETV91624.1 hypothetical protein H310_13874 [Aphanomyces invadans]|eukprot:XP_008879743.1 hypothetical protein H310_13874 [Aphanomyces invadans]
MSDDEGEAKHDGYHGWFKSVPKMEQDFTPQPIIAAAGNLATPAPAGSGSAWNQGGTWEEINKSQWAQDSLRRHILEEFQIVDAKSGWTIRATAIVKCDGDAKLVFSRGKKRCGYDIALEFEYEGVHEGNSETSSGKINLHDFEDTNGEDYEIHVSSNTSSTQDKSTVAIIKQQESALRKVLQAWKQDLLQQ